MPHPTFAPGKIIVSGEYAVVFGYAGLAVPASAGVHAVYEPGDTPLTIRLNGMEPTTDFLFYLETIRQALPPSPGTLTLTIEIPVGKGMGASTAIVIAMAKAILGEKCQAKAKVLEDAVNPGNSGLDFAVIWENQPIKFVKGQVPEAIALPPDLFAKAMLIDTGAPEQSTPELVAWVTSRKDQLAQPLQLIGQCTERILRGDNIYTVIRDHHKAQVALGVVPESVQRIIAEVEARGGSAKVIGAGARTGGGGMVLVLEK